MINCNSVKIRIFSIICWYPWHLKFQPFFFHLQCHLLTNFVGWCGGVIWSCEIPYGKSKEDLMATPVVKIFKRLKAKQCFRTICSSIYVGFMWWKERKMLWWITCWQMTFFVSIFMLINCTGFHLWMNPVNILWVGEKTHYI